MRRQPALEQHNGLFLAYVLDLPVRLCRTVFSAVCSLWQHTAFILLRNRRGLLSLLPRCVLPFSLYGLGKPGLPGSLWTVYSRTLCLPCPETGIPPAFCGVLWFWQFSETSPDLPQKGGFPCGGVPSFLISTETCSQGSEAPSRSHLPAPCSDSCASFQKVHRFLDRTDRVE